MLPRVNMALTICIYAAAMYSCMRSCMTETKTPALSGPWAFIVSMFWFPIMAIAIMTDVFKGVTELLEEKD